MTARPAGQLVLAGWTVFAHPLFLDQVEALVEQVEELRRKDPQGFVNRNATKRLAAISRLAFEIIPEDPTRPEFRQGGSLGDENKHWFRAKFFQQYRLFFRFHAASRVLIYAWVNDDKTKRAYESASDADRIFQRMLAAGRPPDDWATLLAEAKGAMPRLRGLHRRGG